MIGGSRVSAGSNSSPRASERRYSGSFASAHVGYRSACLSHVLADICRCCHSLYCARRIKANVLPAFLHCRRRCMGWRSFHCDLCSRDVGLQTSSRDLRSTCWKLPKPLFAHTFAISNRAPRWFSWGGRLWDRRLDFCRSSSIEVDRLETLPCQLFCDRVLFVSSFCLLC